MKHWKLRLEGILIWWRDESKMIGQPLRCALIRIDVKNELVDN
jgi:hypothetical protein